jgi:outer membrane protein assembly factor BamB
MRFLTRAFIPLWISWAATCAAAGDWPTYRADGGRSGYTADRLPARLSLEWTYRQAHPPMPAWPTRFRERYDIVCQPVIAGETLYFGSSADHKVYALDAASGRLRWEFFSDAPVRFAPAAWKDRLFVAGDDGCLYCLAAADGKLLWKHRGGPRDQRLLGNDRMIARWPARGGPVVADDIVYYGAGIWPSEGVFLYALQADSGQVVWCNDSSGGLEMDQPHPKARAKSGIAAQGYLVVDGDRLLVPTGRAVPALFQRRTGKLLEFQLQANYQLGGSDVMALGNQFHNGGAVFNTAGETLLGRTGVVAAAHPAYLLASKGRGLQALDRRALVVDTPSVDRLGNPIQVPGLARPLFSIELPKQAMLYPPQAKGTEKGGAIWNDLLIAGQPAALIVAGDQAIVGGQDQVLLVDLTQRKLTCSMAVEGVAAGLAVAGGRLYVSTDRGRIHCFSAATMPHPAVVGPTVETPRVDRVYEEAAEEIIRRAGVTEGFCVDLGCGDGQLAMALARRTNLQIYGVESDPALVRSARQRLDRAGLYGVQVTIHEAVPATVPYPNYFADLVVSGRSVADGPQEAIGENLRRLQRPFGGVACVGRPGAMQQSLRGALPGAGSWTHQNANAANTLCSADTAVAAPLAMLWYRDNDLVMPQRHGRGPAPLIDGGRMIVEGINALRAVNVYNGRPLWDFPLENLLRVYHSETSIGAAWTGGNCCLDGDRVYVHTGDRCLCLDAATGRQLRELKPPDQLDGKPGTWGYIACQGGTLFGTLADKDYLVRIWWSPTSKTNGLFTQSTRLFAMDPQSGRVKWIYTPQHSIHHNAIAIGGGWVYLIDRPWAEIDSAAYSAEKYQLEAQRRADAHGTKPSDELRQLLRNPAGRLVALDAAAGKPFWQSDKAGFGTELVLSEKHGLLLVCYQPGMLKSELGNRMAAIRVTDGSCAWDVAAHYVSRPVINDRTIYAEPGAWDLLSGKPLDFKLTRSHGCGIPAGSQKLLVFRSATLGYIDLTQGDQTENYGGIRPGCWLNAIPAGGLVLMADSASWCTCSYLNQATIALEPARANRPKPQEKPREE